MSENLSRRGLLMLGSFAGGLLLPFAGGHALSLVDKRAAADIVVKPRSFLISAQMAGFWTAVEEHAYHRDPVWIPTPGEDVMAEHMASHQAWTARQARIEAAAAMVWRRPCSSWGDVAERAEIAWTAAPKEETWTVPELDDDYYEAQRFTGRLVQGEPNSRTPAHIIRNRSGCGDFSINANAALIEGVLAMTGGRRFSPCIERDRLRSEREGDYEWRLLDDPTAASRPRKEA